MNDDLLSINSLLSRAIMSLDIPSRWDSVALAQREDSKIETLSPEVILIIDRAVVHN